MPCCRCAQPSWVRAALAPQILGPPTRRKATPHNALARALREKSLMSRWKAALTGMPYRPSSPSSCATRPSRKEMRSRRRCLPGGGMAGGRWVRQGSGGQREGRGRRVAMCAAAGVAAAGGVAPAPGGRRGLAVALQAGLALALRLVCLPLCACLLIFRRHAGALAPARRLAARRSRQPAQLPRQPIASGGLGWARRARYAARSAAKRWRRRRERQWHAAVVAAQGCRLLLLQQLLALGRPAGGGLPALSRLGRQPAGREAQSRQAQPHGC